MAQSLILLAEHASLHSDRTLTLVRAGINEVSSASTPVQFNALAIAWYRPDGAATPKQVALVVTGPERNEILRQEYPVDANKVGPATSTFCYSARMPRNIETFGVHRVSFAVDGEEAAFVELNVKQIPAKLTKEGNP